jgi:hypothetical protein
MRSKDESFPQPNKWQMPDKINLGSRVYDNQLKQRSYIGKTKYTLIPLSRKLLNEVQNMHVWFSFLLSVPLAWD